jgi:hypothetical protein
MQQLIKIAGKNREVSGLLPLISFIAGNQVYHLLLLQDGWV